MNLEFRIEVVNPNITAFALHRQRGRPDGVRVGALTIPPVDSTDLSRGVWTFLVVIGGVGGKDARDVLRGPAKDEIKKWLIQLIQAMQAVRVNINGIEPKDDGELERIISHEIEAASATPSE